MLSIASLLTLALAIVTVATLLGSIAVVGRLYPGPQIGEIARSRLVMGVPWGTLLVIGLVCCVYLFVQDGITAFDDPVTIPYRAYSYFYPLGMLTASFSHAGPNHLIGNLAGAVVAAPIAEYAWGHYPDERDDHSSASWRANPWVRALVIFPLAVVAVTIVTSLFALGPVIGFSSVVFAFAAFALVHYPIVTIVGVLGVQGVVLTLYRSFLDPIAVYVAQPSPPSAPSWAGIAIQGHALGFFIGLLLGIAVLRRRDHRPDPFRLWLAVLLYGFGQGLWQIYWFGEENTYFLFRGPGVLLVTALALVVTLAVAGPERSVVPARVDRLFAREDRADVDSPVERPLEIAAGQFEERTDAAAARLERIREIAGRTRSRAHGSTPLSEVGQRQTAYVLVLVVFAVLAGVAIPINFTVPAGDAAGSETAVQVEDYTIEYAEDVENELTSPIRIGPLEEAATLEYSGVIVTSEERHLWSEVIPAHRLAFSGEESVSVGGPGWRETVHVERTGWEPVSNDTVYRVEIRADGEESQLAYESDSSRADVRIDGRTVTIAPEDGEFVLEVESSAGDAVATTAVPEDGESTTAGGIGFERADGTVYAASNGTQVAVASEETYED
ncbi:rhomboid family intramembrane serine protease [Natronorubrum sp. JWXQ-INN-674]|uniref:Rhomboid family intramembrane serine protease n=1 Tax=Natronorubrum halalkaliphilum TaxID=2691917 RepID=A0A6B0VTX5_9EURY|nr:rhomboid family intramembrane serine protease [Natronorubrum halalkaliphilum]MXV64356.1 rhomboid family intramembrane serine protease [Natronorubrum halalkaliphilum]